MKRIPLMEHLKKNFPNIPPKELYSMVMCGEVRVEGEKIIDPKRLVSKGSRVEFKRSPYVSRGGLKLEHALELWHIPVEGKVFLDAGASTGGFTDCLLQHGASRVISVDVGYNQIAYKLRIDSRVTVMENTNIMDISRLEPVPAAATVDLSFRSLRNAAAHIASLTAEGAIIALMKPQFEFRLLEEEDKKENKKVGTHVPQTEVTEFSGVINDPELTLKVLQTSLEAVTREGLYLDKITPSPISGRSGNREFLLLLQRREGAVGHGWNEKVETAVHEAYFHETNRKCRGGREDLLY